MLNHKRKGMERIYSANQELELRAAGFAAWETFLVGIASKCEGAGVLLSPI